MDIISNNQTILLNSKEEILQGAVPSTGTSESSIYRREGILTILLSNFSFKIVLLLAALLTMVVQMAAL